MLFTPTDKGYVVIDLEIDVSGMKEEKRLNDESYLRYYHVFKDREGNEYKFWIPGRMKMHCYDRYSYTGKDERPDKSNLPNVTGPRIFFTEGNPRAAGLLAKIFEYPSVDEIASVRESSKYPKGRIVTAVNRGTLIKQKDPSTLYIKNPRAYDRIMASHTAIAAAGAVTEVQEWAVTALAEEHKKLEGMPEVIQRSEYLVQNKLLLTELKDRLKDKLELPAQERIESLSRLRYVLSWLQGMLLFFLVIATDREILKWYR